MKVTLQKLEGRVVATVRWKLHDPGFNRFWDIGGLKAENRQNFAYRDLETRVRATQGHFGTNGKRVYTLLLDITRNFSPILAA